METKKSPKADLESKRGLFFEIGMLFTLALLLVAFEWTSRPKENQVLYQLAESNVEEEVVPVTRQQQETAPPPPPQQVVTDIIIRDDNVEIEDMDFASSDFDENMSVDFVPYTEEEEEEAAEEEVFYIVEDMPKFQGKDQNEFRTYIQANLKYPEIAAENGISGKVFVQFAVNAKGEVVDVKVARGVDPALDKEAIRVVKSSPKWAPGKQRGRPVKVQFTFPIVFVLQ